MQRESARCDHSLVWQNQHLLMVLAEMFNSIKVIRYMRPPNVAIDAKVKRHACSRGA